MSKRIVASSCLLVVLIVGFAIWVNPEAHEGGAEWVRGEERSSSVDGTNDLGRLSKKSSAARFGIPLTESQVRRVVEKFVRIRLPDVIFESLVSGVEIEQLGLRGAISFSLDPSEIPLLKKQVRQAWVDISNESSAFFFSEVIGLTGLPDVDLDESTINFTMTSSTESLILPEDIARELGFESNRTTKDFQLFVYLCQNNGNVRIDWQNYPD